MRYGFIITGGDPRAIVDLAVEVEAAGWDGVFYYDAMYLAPDSEVYDPWVVLAAIAERTSRLRIGSILTPLPRRRPWKVAREAMTLDRLSHGRLILAVGLGALETGFDKLGEQTDRRVRAQLLDESLDILTGLWSGEPFSYAGTHYQVDDVVFRPTPVQQPRIPIWVVGAPASPKSFARALRYDGLLPAGVESDQLASVAARVAAEREESSPYDIVWEGVTPGNDRAAATAHIQPLADAGVTWWLEAHWDAPGGLDTIRERARQGPPQVDQERGARVGPHPNPSPARRGALMAWI